VALRAVHQKRVYEKFTQAAAQADNILATCQSQIVWMNNPSTVTEVNRV
jgi:hypothetical protein